MTFKPGVSGNPDGCPKGVKQKATKVKLAFFEAFEESGGIKALIEWARKNSNKREFYKIIVQLLPKDLAVEVTDETWEKYKNFTPEELDAEELRLARAIVRGSADKKAQTNGATA